MLKNLVNAVFKLAPEFLHYIKIFLKTFYGVREKYIYTTLLDHLIETGRYFSVQEAGH